MPTPSSQADNRFSRQRVALFGGVVAGWLFSLGLYFNQPSLLGLTDAAGAPVGRLVDLMQLLLLDQVVAGTFAHGRLEAGILDRWPLLLGICAWLALSGLVGLPLLLASRLRESVGRLELTVLAVMVGATVLSTVTLGVGVGGGLDSRWILLSLFALLAVASVAFVGRQTKQERRQTALSGGEPPRRRAAVRNEIEPSGQVAVWLARLLPVATVTVALLTLLGCLLPPWEFDVMEYHLQAPKEFAQAGAIGFVPHNVYANMPLGAEMHSLAAMTIVGGSEGWWWGGLIGKSIIGIFSLLAAILLGSFIARKYGSWSGWAAAALLIASPGSAHVSMAGLIDMVLAAYLLSAIVVTTILWPQLRTGTARFCDGFLVGLLVGGAAACKYPGLLFVVVPVVVAVLFAVAKAGSKPFAVRMVSGLSVGMGITCLPWYAKNWWWTGNPFFPLATRVFGPNGLSAEQIVQWQQAHRVPSLAGGSIYGPAALWDAGVQTLLRNSFLPPTLVFLTLCGVAMVWFKPTDMSTKWSRGWLYLLGWVGLVWWLGTHRIDRFWLPALPLACGLAALGATWIARRLSLALASVMVLLSLLYGGFVIASGAIGDNRLFVRLSALREDSGTTEFPGRMTPLVGWINAELDGDDVRLLLIGEAKVYDFRMPIVYATCFDRSPAEDWLRGKTPEQQQQNLMGAGITHVLIHWREIARYRSPGNYGFSAWPQRDDVAQLVADQVLRPMHTPFDPQDAEVFEVLTPQASNNGR